MTKRERAFRLLHALSTHFARLAASACIVLTAPVAVQSAPSPDAELIRSYLGGGDWVVAGDANIGAYGAAGWRGETELAAAAARHSLPRVAAVFGLAEADVLPVWIVVAPDEGRLHREAPSWSAALARPGLHLVVLSGPALQRAHMNLQETVAHELVHLVLHRRLGESGWMPLWLHEGLAVHFSGYRRTSDRLLTLGRGPVHLAELEDAFPDNALRARLAYLESAAAVRRLLRMGPIEPLLDRVGAGEEFAVAFDTVYGKMPHVFAREVYDEVEQRWRYLPLLTSGGTLFGLMTLLLVVAVLRKRARDRRRLRAWAEDDAGV